jgi:phosphohistidine phosphatase
MKLFLMRHAEAISSGGSIRTDAERPLSPYGEKQARAIAEQMRERGFVVERIFCSPLTRTRQTAEQFEKVLGCVPQIAPVLEPTGDVTALRVLLDEDPGSFDRLLIGHHPDLALLANSLGAPNVTFSPGALAYFEWDPDKLDWVYREFWRPEDFI